MAKWYYLIGGKETGPLESAELKRLADSGGLRPSDKVRRKDMAKWYQASQINGLFTPGEPRYDSSSLKTELIGHGKISSPASAITTANDEGSSIVAPPNQHSVMINRFALVALSSASTVAVVLILLVVVALVAEDQQNLRNGSHSYSGSEPSSPMGQTSGNAQDNSTRDDADESAQALWGAILNNAARNAQAKRQRDAEAQQWYQKTFSCRACGNSGYYRYVDRNGVLQLQICPHCRGGDTLRPQAPQPPSF